MSDLIQFDCPSCAATLRVPLEMAGHRGPCPLCHRDIVAPNPYTGIGAHFPPHQPMPDIGPVETILPRLQSLPEIQEPSPPVQEAGFPFSPPVETKPKSRRGMVVFVCLCLILLALAAGFFIGNHLRQDPASSPLVIPQKTPLSPATTPPAAQAPSVDPAKKSTEAPRSEKPPVNQTSLESAQATLKAFLDAPDWAARGAYVLSPQTVRPKMEAYAQNNPDGPTPYSAITVANSEVDANTGTTLLIFRVETTATTGEIPVAVLETKKGWFVDWESFVEFRDDLFKDFAEGPSDHVGEFHLIVTAPEATPGNQVENETYGSFVVAPPLPGRQKTAFIKKTNPFYTQLREATRDSRHPFTPVLKITKSTTDDGRSYLEILSIEATDWRPRGATPEP